MSDGLVIRNEQNQVVLDFTSRTGKILYTGRLVGETGSVAVSGLGEGDPFATVVSDARGNWSQNLIKFTFTGSGFSWENNEEATLVIVGVL